jgi:hypothetical protein
MTLFCVTCDQIDKWMKDFNENNSPEDLVIVNDPKLFLSCRLGGSTANKAYACYGDELAEEINSSEDVYSVAQENCNNPMMPDFEIKTQIESLVELKKQSLNPLVYFRAIEMLKKLETMRDALDIREWEIIINSLPGSEDQGIQVALRMAKNLHELWANAYGREAN